MRWAASYDPHRLLSINPDLDIHAKAHKIQDGFHTDKIEKELGISALIAA